MVLARAKGIHFPWRRAAPDPGCSNLTPLMASNDSWVPAPAVAELAEGEIHLWRAHLPLDETALRRLRSTLSSDEQDRARRFHFRRDGDRFISGRGILRDLLGRYSRHTPSEISFDYNELGKPSVSAPRSARDICFNLSHSHELVLLAFTTRRNLGVDVEWLRPDFGGADIAQRYFAQQEIAEFRSLPPSRQAEGFFLCWTRKEAYIKARGEGLKIPLDSFHVSLTPGQPARLYCEDRARWSLTSVDPYSGYVGAMVVEGQSPQLKFWDWNMRETR